MSDTPLPDQPPTPPAVFGLRTAALAGLLVAAATIAPPPDTASAPRDVFTDTASAFGCLPFPTCCGTHVE